MYAADLHDAGINASILYKQKSYGYEMFVIVICFCVVFKRKIVVVFVKMRHCNGSMYKVLSGTWPTLCIIIVYSHNVVRIGLARLDPGVKIKYFDSFVILY